MKLLIAIPSYRDPKRAFTYSLTGLAVTLMREKYESGLDIDFTIAPFANTSDIALGRNLIAEHALKGGYDYLLAIDDDMKFDPEAFFHLLSRKKDIVVANCITKSSKRPVSSLKGEVVYSKGKSGIETVDKTGLAFALIKIDVFKKLPKPFFESRVYSTEQGMKGDLYI